MSQYVDGFVLPISKDKVEAYRLVAEKASKLFIELGALEYRECIGDDFEAHEMRSFPAMAGAGPDETVVFAWISYISREHRDEVNAKIMADPRMGEMMADGCPFDMTRMAYGGFKTIVKA